MIGQKFNRLTVRSLSHKGSNYHRYWLCDCECGKSKVIDGVCLRNGNTKSCGCLQKERVSKTLRGKLKGRIFGRLTVIKLNNIKDNSCYWKCRCKCGNITIVIGENLTNSNTKSCGCLLSENRSKKQKGNLNHKWRSNLSKEERELNNKRSLLPRCRAWRKRVYKRDDYTCQISGQRGGVLCAHHLSAWMKSPSLRYRTSNGVTLTLTIHKLFHKIYGKSFNTPRQFKEFRERFLNNEFKS